MSVFEEGKKPRAYNRLFQPSYIQADQWIDYLKPEQYCWWLKFHTWVNRTSTRLYEQHIPYTLESVFEKLGVSKATFYRKIKVIWECGLIDLVEYEKSERKTTKPRNIIVYEYPFNNPEYEYKPLKKMRDWDKDYESESKKHGFRGALTTRKDKGLKTETVENEGENKGLKTETVEGLKTETVTVSKLRPNNYTNNILINTNKHNNNTNNSLEREKMINIPLPINDDDEKEGKKSSVNIFAFKEFVNEFQEKFPNKFSNGMFNRIYEQMHKQGLEIITYEEAVKQARYMVDREKKGEIIGDYATYFVGGIKLKQLSKHDVMEKRIVKKAEQEEKERKAIAEKERKAKLLRGEREERIIPFYNWLES